MKERPKVRTVTPSYFLQNLLIDFEGSRSGGCKIEGKVLMKEETREISIFGFKV